MNDTRITYEDVKEHEALFSLAPAFLLERFARKNTNLVLKFKPAIQTHISNLSDYQKSQLNLIVGTDVDELQKVMHDAYLRSHKKQYQILANPKYKKFIELNIDEIRRLI